MVWLIGKGDTLTNRHNLGVFRPPGLEPSIPLSSSHRNRGAPWEVARDNIFEIVGTASGYITYTDLDNVPNL